MINQWDNKLNFTGTKEILEQMKVGLVEIRKYYENKKIELIRLHKLKEIHGRKP